MNDIAHHTIVLSPSSVANNSIAPDLVDQFLRDLLAVRADLVLVTGDKLQLQDALMQDRVILPQKFCGAMGALRA